MSRKKTEASANTVTEITSAPVKVQQHLTLRQRQVFKIFRKNEGSFAVFHRKNNGTCYRLLTADRNPIMNITSSVFRRLIDKEMFESKIEDGHKVFVLSQKGKDYPIRNRKNNK